MRPVLLVVSGILLLSALSTVAVAGEGRMPVWQPISIGPGGEGHYILTRDVTAIPGQPIIDVQPGVVAVEIDLNGFTLYGIDTDVIRAKQVDSLTVRNGTITTGTGNGIYFEEGRKVVIEDLRIQFQGDRGILLNEVVNFAVRRNIIVATAGAALWIDGFFNNPDPVEGVIEDNQFQGCGDGIVLQNGSSVAIRNNRVEAMANDGIRVNECGACLILENTIQDVGAMGIVTEPCHACKLENNLVYQSGEGIMLLNGTEDCLVLNNVSSRNNGNGMVVDGFRNHVDRNVINFNGFAGIWFAFGSADNTFGRNTARANGAIGPPGPCALTVFPCGAPDICIETPTNTSWGDNMGPAPGC